MKKAISALLVRFFGLFAGVTAITLQLVFNITSNNGFMSNHVLAYFTLQTNIFTTVIFALLLLKTAWVGIKTHKLEVVHIYPSFHLGCTFYITITMLVYWLVLAPTVGLAYKNPLLISSNIFLHTITPLFAIVDCIFFFKHGSLNWKDAFKWLTYPILYLISVIIIANVSTEPYYIFPMNGKDIALMYPYPFLDPQVVGVGGMIGVIIALCLLVIGFGSLYVFVDNKIAKGLAKKQAQKDEQIA